MITPLSSWKTASVHQKHPVPKVAVSVFVPAGIVGSLIILFLIVGCLAVEDLHEAKASEVTTDKKIMLRVI